MLACYCKERKMVITLFNRKYHIQVDFISSITKRQNKTFIDSSGKVYMKSNILVYDIFTVQIL